MSEQYKCNKCGYVFDMSDMMCSECGDGFLEPIPWTKGGNGSHWDGCEEVHWDCKIAQLEAELARRDDLIKRLKDAGNELYLKGCRNYLPLGDADWAWRALMKELETK